MQRIIGTTLVAATAITALAAPAVANHDERTTAYHREDTASIVATTGSGAVHDQECDGNPARVVLVYVVDGERRTLRKTDLNECEPGGARFTVPDYTARTITVQELTSGVWLSGETVTIDYGHGVS